MVIIVMGVSGVGKTTLGRALAEALAWDFVEGDDYHPPENVAKMRRGEPLDDRDRAPWLTRLRRLVEQGLASDRGLVLSCSALKQRYREALGGGLDGVRFVLVSARPELLAERLRGRRGHFFPASLLASQFDELEPPHGVISLEATMPTARQIERIRADLRL